MLRAKILASVLSLLIAAGCGGTPTIDASSDDALKASIAAINRSLDEPKKKQFAVDCAVAIFPDPLNMNRREKVPESTSLFSKLHGLTAVGVHKKAEEIRSDMQMNLRSTRPPEPSGDLAKPGRLLADRPAPEGPPSGVRTAAMLVVPPPIVGHVKPPGANLVPDPAWVAKPGAPANLFDKAGGMIYICHDKDAFGEYAMVALTKDQAGLDNLLARKRASLAENGTSVEVIALHEDPSIANGVPVLEVNLKQGFFMGRSAWVAVASVASLVDANSLLARQYKGPDAKNSPRPAPRPPAETKPREQAKAKVVDKSGRARRDFEGAMHLEDTGKIDAALKAYRNLKRDYPDTPSAADASDRIDALTGRPRKK